MAKMVMGGAEWAKMAKGASEGVERALPKWTFRKVRPKKQEAFWLPLHRLAAGGPPHNGSLAVLGA